MSENTPELAVENATSDASLEATRQMSDKINLAIDEDPSKFRVLTGARPTGHLHIGHYFGTLQNWVKLQKRGVDTWLLIADYQVITDRDEADSIQERTMSLLTDYLAVGMDQEEPCSSPTRKSRN